MPARNPLFKRPSTRDRPKTGATSDWVWYCSNCNAGPLSTSIDEACPTCRHWRCEACLSEQVRTYDSIEPKAETEELAPVREPVLFASTELDDGTIPVLASPAGSEFDLADAKFPENEAKPLKDFDPPANTLKHTPLMMGDSVGFKGGKHAATLGPLLRFEGKLYWLVMAHVFDGAFIGENIPDDVKLVHPSEIDCPPGVEPTEIGTLKYWSGPLYSTHRSSDYLRTFFSQVPIDHCAVITDWALCQAYGDGLAEANSLRFVPEDRVDEVACSHIRSFFLQDPKSRVVKVTGRSSGLRYAIVSETLAAVEQNITTHELYIQNAPGWPGMMTRDGWNSGGTGIPGDAGACVIDDETEALLGIVWGRNTYDGDTSMERITYFTSICDIFDDIYEKCPDLGLASIAGGDSYRPDRQTGPQLDEAESDVDKVFSDMESISSQSSAQSVETQAFRETLATLFVERSGLVVIFKARMRFDGIEGKELANELRHALRDLGKGLEQDSKTMEQKACSRRIKRDASYIADSVWRTCDPDFAGHRLEVEKLTLSGEDQRRYVMSLLQKGKSKKEHLSAPDMIPEVKSHIDNDDESEANFELEQERKLERQLSEKIEELENFILESEHVVILKTKLRALLEQDQITRGVIWSAGENLQNAIEEQVEENPPDKAQQHFSENVKNTTIIGRTLPEIVDRWLPQWFDVLWEPPISPGTERIRWTCSCGQRLYDDYADPVTAEIRKLQLHPQRSRQPNPTHTQKSNNQATQGPSNISGPAGTGTSAGSASSQGLGGGSSIPSRTSIMTGPSIPSQTGSSVQRNRLFLLFSIQAGKEGYANVLRHAYVDQMRMTNDNALFKLLREKYMTERKLSSRFTLRTVSEIGNCMLRVDFSNFIQNMKRHSAACRVDPVFSCGCWPVIPAIYDYRYIPQAPTEAFDVGKNYLIHHFRNPGCLDQGQTSVLCHMPLKKDTVLVAEAGRAVTGWGVYFDEDWHWKTICVVITVLMILVSIALGFTWWFAKSDFSGGWGVASFCVTSATLVVTVVGLMAHKSY